MRLSLAILSICLFAFANFSSIEERSELQNDNSVPSHEATHVNSDSLKSFVAKSTTKKTTKVKQTTKKTTIAKQTTKKTTSKTSTKSTPATTVPIINGTCPYGFFIKDSSCESMLENNFC